MTPHAFSASRQNQRDAIAIIKMLTPVVFIFGIGLWAHEFVWNAIASNVAINSGIILAATYGVILILIRLISAQIDFRVIERFGYEASQGVYMKTLLDEPWLKRRYVRHYLSHIANTGGVLSSQMDQSAIESELHALQGEYDSKLELPQFIVGFMIAMGLLGTFIGLLTTLTGISGMLDGMGGTGTDVQEQFMKLVVELRKPLNGMGIAFSASMFGLITSLMLAIMMTNLRRYISRVMALARNVMHELTEMARTSGGATSVKQLTPEEIAAMAHDKPATGGGGGGSSISNTLLAGRFEVLSKRIEQLLEAFEASIAGTQKMTDLLGFGPRMKEISERTLDELKQLSTRYVDQQKTLQLLIEVNTEGTRMAGLQLEAQKQARETADQTLTALRNMAMTQEEQRKLTHNLVDVGSKTGFAANDLLEAQKLGRAELALMLQGVSERMAKLEEANIGSGRHLWEVKENFIKLCKSLGVMDMIASGVGGQTMLLEALVEEARGTQKVLTEMHQDMRGQSGNER